MHHEADAPFHLVGEDRWCGECSRHLLHINDDGSFEHDECLHLRIEGSDEKAADGRPIGRVKESNCLHCHPELIATGMMTDLPPPIRNMISQMLGIPMPTAEPLDSRIQAPWN